MKQDQVIDIFHIFYNPISNVGYIKRLLY